MRQIDADRLVAVLQNQADHLIEAEHKDAGWIVPVMMACIDVVNAQPTIDAGGPVVRCRDCKHYDPFSGSDRGWCNYLWDGFNHDDFCSHGERRPD